MTVTNTRMGQSHDPIWTPSAEQVAATYDYVYRDVCVDVHLASISGGTDLAGGLVAGDTIGPVWAGEIQAAVLGMAIDIFDEHGRVGRR